MLIVILVLGQEIGDWKSERQISLADLKKKIGNGNREFIFTEADQIDLHLLHDFNSQNVEALFQNARAQ